MKAFRLAVGLMAIAFVSGCGDSSPTTPSTTNQGTTVSIPMNATGLGSSAYAPNPVTISAGTTVRWVNNDSIAHTSTSDAGSFDTGTIAAGASASSTFQTAGSFPYHCTFHRGMVGTVIVQ
jgi:plastocyanin